MGKGRDKRKKKEDATKTIERARRQALKLHKRDKKADAEPPEGEPERFNNEENVTVTLHRLRRAEEKRRTTMELDGIEPPSPRANVVFLPHPTRDHELIVFGGEMWNGEVTEVYNDLYVFHTQKQRWSKLDSPVNPSPRSSAQGVTYKEHMIVFGGEFVSQSQSQYHHFKDVWRFDARRYEWQELKTIKGGPSSRSGHRMCMWRRSAVMFGGFYDNALECHYYNDLWVLSQLDGAGQWTKIETSPLGSSPHPRSGHSLAVHHDTVFVFGGYSTEKFNRFKKSEATVHHDLWTLTLPEAGAEALPLWTKLRLGGIPPPIRSGVGFTTKDRRLYLFGGVVDIESPGGKLVSTFHNDLFVLHLESKRFYPVVLTASKKRATGGPDGETREVGSSLAEELSAMNLVKGSAKAKPQSGLAATSAAHNPDDDDEDDDEDEDEDEGNTTAAMAGVVEPKKVEEMKVSYETNSKGQIAPHRRMDCALCAVGNQLYFYGGQFESGKRDITLNDLFSLNTNTLDTYKVIQSQDLSKAVWLGHETESNAGSWESGSTVVTGMIDYDLDEEEDEESATGGVPPQLNPEDDDIDNPPEAIPVELGISVTPALADVAGALAAGGGVDGRTTVRGKKGMKVHKEQLLSQLGVGSSIPTPLADETGAAFFARTKRFWVESAVEAMTDGASADAAALPRKMQKRVEKEARGYALRRYEEARELLGQLRLVEEREKEELEFFRQRRADKEREWQEYEEQQRRDELEVNSNVDGEDDEDGG